MNKKAFTLIELLVVITIIALLVSILMPALAKAKEQARQVVCASSLKGQTTGVIIYTNGNNGKVPLGGGGSWLWDMQFQLTNLISKMAGFKDNEIYFCSSNKQNVPNDARWWQHSYCVSVNPSTGPVALLDESNLTAAQLQDYYRVMCYVYTFDRNVSSENNLSSTNPVYHARVDVEKGNNGVLTPNYWISNVDRVKHTTDKPLICDTVLSSPNGTSDITCYSRSNGDYNFFEIKEGGSWSIYQTYDFSNHRSRKSLQSSNGTGPAPSGGNIAYVDGHVQWKKFDNMDMRIAFANLHWWW